jgi:hypothetical protein
MKKLIAFSLFYIATLGTSIQTWAQESRSFSVSGFTKLEMGSAFNINIAPGNQFKVVAEGRSEDINDLVATVSGGELKLKYKNDGWKTKNRKEVRVSITMPALEGLDLSGACKANLAKFPQSAKFEIEVSGASQVTGELLSKVVEMDLSGASQVTLMGTCEKLDVEISGASSLKGKDFEAKMVKIEASGASNAMVVAHQTLLANASGASSIKFIGNAKDVKTSTSGASSIKRQ